MAPGPFLSERNPPVQTRKTCMISFNKKGVGDHSCCRVGVFFLYFCFSCLFLLLLLLLINMLYLIYLCYLLSSYCFVLFCFVFVYLLFLFFFTHGAPLLLKLRSAYPPAHKKAYNPLACAERIPSAYPGKQRVFIGLCGAHTPSAYRSFLP